MLWRRMNDDFFLGVRVHICCVLERQTKYRNHHNKQKATMSYAIDQGDLNTKARIKVTVKM